MFGLSKRGNDLADEVDQKLRDLGNTRPDSRTRKQAVLDLLDLFRRSPPSTRHLYDLDGTDSTALHWFLRQGEDVESIQVVCQIGPRKIFQTKDSNRDLPLHVACRYSSPAVIEYLIKKSSKRSLRQLNTNGFLACHYALLNTMHEIPLSTMSLLLGHNKNDSDWNLCWSLALVTGQPPALLELMLEKYPNRSGYLNTFFRQIVFNEARAISLAQAAVFTKVCQKLKHLSFHYKPGWNRGAFVCFLNGLQSSTTLIQMEGITLPDLASPLWKHEVLEALQSFVAKNNGLKKLSLHLQESDVQIWHSWIQAMEKGLARNSTLDFLKFDCVVGDSNHLQHAIFESKLDNHNQRQSSLCLGNFNGDDASFTERLRLSPQSLQSLTLATDQPQATSTSSLVAFLLSAPSLR